MKLEQIIEVIALLIRNVAMLIDKLRSGEIDVDDVDLRDWIEKLEDLNDLPEEVHKDKDDIYNF